MLKRIESWANEAQCALGRGRPEGAYERVLAELLIADGFSVECQREIYVEVAVGGRALNVLVGRCDMIVNLPGGHPILLELKAGVELKEQHREQLERYATDLDFGFEAERAFMLYFDLPDRRECWLVPLDQVRMWAESNKEYRKRLAGRK